MVVVAGKEHAIIVQAAEGFTRDALARMAAISKIRRHIIDRKTGHNFRLTDQTMEQ